MVTIEFGPSTSRNHPHAVKIAQSADEYTYHQDTDRHAASYSLPRFPEVERLIDITCGWKSTVLAVNGEHFGRYRVPAIRAIYNCWKRASRLPHPEAHCQSYRQLNRDAALDYIQRNLMQCRYVSIDVKHPTRGIAYWFQSGYIGKRGQWVVDRDHTRKHIENMISESMAGACPLFDVASLKKALKMIPSEIEASSPGEPWAYMMIGGNVVGVTPIPSNSNATDYDNVVVFPNKKERSEDR